MPAPPRGTDTNRITAGHGLLEFHAVFDRYTRGSLRLIAVQHAWRLRLQTRGLDVWQGGCTYTFCRLPPVSRTLLEATMKRYTYLTVAMVALLWCARRCGGNHTGTSAGPTNVTINTGDATNDEIVKFELTVSSLTLTGSGGTPNTGNLLSKSAEVEFAHQAGSFEPLALVNIPPGTYSGASLTVSNPEIVVLNSAVPPAPVKITATLSSPSVTLTFGSPITVTNSNSTVINFDLDLAGSVTLSGTPPTSASVTPKFNVTAGTANNQGDDRGEIENIHGSVTSIA